MKKKIIISVFMITALAVSIFAQKNMNEDFRKTAPAPLPQKPFDIPKPFETVLPNGLKVVVFEDSRLPLVSYRLAFKTGEINDPANSVGLTSAMTSLLNEGTKTRSSKQLAEEIERLGANISASASEDNTIVAASALKLYSPDVLRLMADMVLNPTFPDDELALYKKNTLEGLKLQRSQPAFLADEQISKALYGSHPYGIVSPSPADVEKLTQEKLKAFHDKILVPNNATLIVVGDVNRDNLLKEIKDNFGSWKKGTIESMKFPAVPKSTATTLTVVDRPGSIQSNIVLGIIGIERNNPDYFPVLVMNQVLGAGPSSRLFLNLREDKGYTYGAYSNFDTKRLLGNFQATAEVRSPVTGDSLKEFFYELNRIRSEKVAEKELKDAKSFLTGVFPLRAETQEGLTNLLVSQQLYDLPADYLQSYRNKINAVTLDDVERVAKKYIAPDKVAIVVVGDADAIINQVKPYSKTINVVDAQGVAQDINNYGKETSGETANANGKWNLTVEFQGQQIPISLMLKQSDANIVGTVESPLLGSGEFSNAKLNGNKFVGTTKMQIQGQPIELTFNGTIKGDTMNGSITSPIPQIPALPFTGKRDSSMMENSEMNKPDMKDSGAMSAENNIQGDWMVSTQGPDGSPLDVSVNFVQNGNNLSGKVSTPLGNGTVSKGKVDGKKVTATLSIDFQGQPLDVMLEGNLENKTMMKGNLMPQIPGVSNLPFTATKKQ